MIAELPPPVRPGDRVGVAALSGPVDPARLEAGVATLLRFGFEPVLAENLHLRTPLFAGGDGERLKAFHQLAADPSLAAILFARGGHGVLRLLEGIDWELLARRPRAYVGYSDLTAFLNQVVTRLGLVAFHGPMVAVELADEPTFEEELYLLGALAGELPLEYPVEAVPGAPSKVAEGTLLGGCLSLLTSTLETDFAPELDDAILFWEDIGEPLYRLDRMLTHLRLAGRLAGLRGVIAGRIELADEEPLDQGVEDLLAEMSRDLGWPAASGLASGHCRPNLTLPLGLVARLDAAAGRLVIEEEQGRGRAED